MLLYVSGPYSGDVDKNIDNARLVALRLWNHGHVVICPHTNTAHFEDHHLAVEYDQWIAGDLAILERCDGVVMLEGWRDSKGATKEHAHAEMLGMPIWYVPDMPSLHPVETQSPQQVAGFLRIVMGMYRLHLRKNADYSPANILATGEIGLVTRLWDKVARLMNLTGFRVEIAGSRFEMPSTPKNESIDDTFLDTAVYSVIGLLLRRGVWGK